MKIFAFFAILILGFTLAITAAVKPDVIEQNYLAIRASIDQYFAKKREMVWREAKDSERSAWMLKQQMPADCKMPKTAIRELECSNKKQLLAHTFEREWTKKVNSGWKPDGVW